MLILFSIFRTSEYRQRRLQTFIIQSSSWCFILRYNRYITYIKDSYILLQCSSLFIIYIHTLLFQKVKNSNKKLKMQKPTEKMYIHTFQIPTFISSPIPFRKFTFLNVTGREVEFVSNTQWQATIAENQPNARKTRPLSLSPPISPKWETIRCFPSMIEVVCLMPMKRYSEGNLVPSYKALSRIQPTL